MTRLFRINFMFCILAASLVALLPTKSDAQGTTAFTYQGQLRDNGTNANGAYTITFKLYDAVTNGNEIGLALTNNVNLDNGLFTVNLDFGASAFTGSECWLGIAISNGGIPQTLYPRVIVTPVPYALHALTSGNPTNSSGGGTISSTNVIFGGGGSSWDIGIDPSGNLDFTYGDPLTNTYVTPCGVLNVRSNVVVADGDFIALNGGVQLNGPLGHITFPDGSVQTNAAPNLGDWTISITTYNGFSDLLAVQQDGINRALFSGGQYPTALSLMGDLQMNGNIKNVTEITGNGGNISFNGDSLDDVSTINGSGGTLYVSSNLTVFGCINGQFCQSSDRNLKDSFSPVNSREILDVVAGLPISSWRYKSGEKTRHVGPMAQDFYSAFHLGADDKHINTVDEGGVALAAIQGLNEKVEAEAKAKDAKIAELEKRLADLEILLKAAVKSGGERE